MKKYALISVSDKRGITELAKAITEQDYKILATGNTAKILRDSGIEVMEVSSLTGFPEVFDGRVKTLHPKIFGGILYRRDLESDAGEAEKNEISPIDIVCVNLYPFKKTADNPDSTFDEIIENIDIGGPSLIRASAKNYKYVSVLTDPGQYGSYISELNSGEISLRTREKLSAEAFAHTANYDIYIADYLEKKFDAEQNYLRLSFKKEKELRYGENPHQRSSLYGDFGSYFEVFHGKEISYNNILDLISAAELAEDLGENSCTIIKHNNPAGAATGENGLDAYLKALKCDPVSAFGGIVAFTSEVDEAAAEKLNEIFLEVISAPSYTEGAKKILTRKKDRRLVIQKKKVNEEPLSLRNIPGGVIVQDSDRVNIFKDRLKKVTKKAPGKEETEDLIFAWKVAKHTKSNAIVFVKNKSTLGVGAGQMSRIDSAKIAKMKAEEHGLDLTGSVAASDAFFPFPDGLLEIIKCGAVSVIQPGGSIRDEEVIEAADKNNISMVFTGVRHFKH